jgi:FAD:protein FMN transferase
MTSAEAPAGAPRPAPDAGSASPLPSAPRRRALGRLARLGALGLSPALVAVPWLSSCSQPPPTVHTLQGQTMGTGWTARLGGSLPAPLPVLRGEIEALLEAVNAEMSTWRADSVISRFNQATAGEAVDLPPGFASVLAAALTLARETAGAYDPTVGPLVNLWGFGPDGTRRTAPSGEAVAAARERVGWQRLDFDPAARRLVQPGGLYLDLSSIAKGHGVDRVVDHLHARGLRSVMFDIGGDLRVIGRRPDGQAWQIGIERPAEGLREVQTVVGMPADQALATSGSYRNFFRDGGRRFAHLIDPRTAEPVDHRLVSVSVLHASCTQADALATALSVLGPDAGMAFAQARGLAVLLLEADAEDPGDPSAPRVTERSTPGFAQLLALPPR